MADTTNKDMQEFKIKTITFVGLMTALICILGPLSIPLPFSPVPISMANLAINFVVYVVGMKLGTISCLVYLLIGFVGVPVFSSFTCGPGKLFGPTGGYLIGYVFQAVICGVFIEKWPKKISMHFIGMAAGQAVCYLFGTVWLAYQADLSFPAALTAGVLPFIPGDLVKIIIAILIGTQVRQKMYASTLL